ncbi:ABC transporter permease subunit [Georgenia sp. SUBG003]|uniref:ABC transporter permease subunit n=1 Tax=Georgenia sp. SUBG003 TaxID=1497974 RepID=UPI003AB27E11
MLATNDMPLVFTIPFVIVACIGAGVIIGGPTLRLRSDYLAIVTLGFGEIIRLTANNLEITGGPSGISGIPTFGLFGWTFRDGVDLFGIHFSGNILLYWTERPPPAAPRCSCGRSVWGTAQLVTIRSGWPPRTVTPSKECWGMWADPGRKAGE